MACGHLARQFPEDPLWDDPGDAVDSIPGAVWQLHHYKIRADSDLTDDEMGYKMIGLYKYCRGSPFRHRAAAGQARLCALAWRLADTGWSAG
ncbi:MAG: hypothetical protein H7345_10435 [Rubritepida sp.]|nr:hypothetical protein [Rubritepida sp.]